MRPGYLLVLLASALFAAGGNAAKTFFQQGYSPALLAQLRIGWAFAWLGAALLLLRPPLLGLPLRELPGLAWFGVVGVTGVQLAYYLAIARLNIAVALLVQYLGLVAVAAWERYRRQQAVPGPVWGALVLVLAGSFLTVGGYRLSLLKVNLPGIGFGLLAAALFAYYLLRGSSLTKRLNSWTMLVYAFGAGTVFWSLYDLLTRPVLPQDPAVWAAMAMIGLFGTAIPFGLIITALKTVRPSRAGIVGTAEPVFAGLIALVVFGNRLERLQLLGAAAVIAGIVVVQRQAEVEMNAPVGA